MRKIETLMNDAIANNKDWQSGNTSVSYNEENGVSVVRLHGNKIAEVGDDFLQIFDGGWQSNTTKSRLNAMIDRFCNATTDGVFQKDFCWFIRDNNVTRDFDNGYIFAWSNHGQNQERMGINLCPFLYHLRSPNSSLMMTETKDNIVDRDELQDSYIDAILDDTSAKTMRMIAYDYLNDNLDGYTVDELITEVEDYYPHLLE